MTLKAKSLEPYRRYLAALRGCVGRRRPTGAAAARALGRDFLALGLNARDLASLHERSLGVLAQSPDFVHAPRALIGRAGKFLNEALLPFARSHRAAHASLQQVRQRAATLRLNRAALAAGNRRLAREVKRRKAGQETMKRTLVHNHRLFKQSQLMQKQLRKLARQILTAQEDERRKISGELHDKVVQILMAINVELTALGRTPSAGGAALKGRISYARRLVEKAVGTVHRYARELRPALLDDLGLIPALRVYMEGLAARKRLIIRLTAFGGVEKLASNQRTVLFRVAQEALTNVVRLAQASRVNMIISELPGAVRMEVNDDGKSFSALKALSSRIPRRISLLGMRERVEMVGGSLALESAPGLGTSVRVEIPSGAGGAK